MKAVPITTMLELLKSRYPNNDIRIGYRIGIGKIILFFGPIEDSNAVLRLAKNYTVLFYDLCTP